MSGEEVLSQEAIDALMASSPEDEAEKLGEVSFLVQPEIKDTSQQKPPSSEAGTRQSTVVETATKEKPEKAAPKVANLGTKDEQRLAAIEEEMRALRNEILPELLDIRNNYLSRYRSF